MTTPSKVRRTEGRFCNFCCDVFCPPPSDLPKEFVSPTGQSKDADAGQSKDANKSTNEKNITDRITTVHTCYCLGGEIQFTFLPSQSITMPMVNCIRCCNPMTFQVPMKNLMGIVLPCAMAEDEEGFFDWVRYLSFLMAICSLLMSCVAYIKVFPDTEVTGLGNTTNWIPTPNFTS